MNIWNSFVSLLEQILLTFQAWTGNAGVAIILFTVLARLIILPLTLQSIKSSRRMQAVQPQMKELQRKYGKDPQKLNEETAKLYREAKVNPVGGCLPLFLQLPIFFGVYQAVIKLAQIPPSEGAASAMLNGLNTLGVNTTQFVASLGANRLSTDFLWLRDLGRPDPLFILPVLSVILQLLVQLMSTPRVQDAQQKAMTQSMLILPVVFGYIGFTFPSGAVLYWVVGSLLSVIQTYVMSGWGSLANYLKFLPTDAGLFPPPVITTSASEKSSDAPSARPALAIVTPTDESPRRSFWDVLAPLTEQASTATATVGVGDSSSVEDTNEATNAEVRRRVEQNNPRRRSKARR